VPHCSILQLSLDHLLVRISAVKDRYVMLDDFTSADSCLERLGNLNLVSRVFDGLPKP
jgi:hypothetical protein